MPRNILALLGVMLLCLASANAGEHRVISLVPSQTELLYAMGFEAAIAGVSDFCNFPEAAADKPKIGGLELNVERIMSLRPTLLVDANSMHRKYEPLFQQLGLKYVDFATTRLDHLPQVAASLSQMLDAPENGIRFAANWNARLRQLDLQKPTRKILVYFEIWDTPAQAAGQSSFIGELITRAGGQNIFSGSGDFPVANAEMVIKENPDVILVAYPLPNLEKIKNRPGWSHIKAIKSNRLHALNQDLFVRPGPRNLDAIEQLNRIFHEVSNP